MYSHMKAEYIASAENRFVKTKSDKSSFLEANSGKELGENSERFIPSNDINNLTFRTWIEHSSYTFCNKCMMILLLGLLRKFSKRPLIKEGSKLCQCQTKRYRVPQPNGIADVLWNLSHAEICALRPLTDTRQWRLP